MRPGWFGPKVVGWGFAPRSWQGWLVIVALIAIGYAVGKVPGISLNVTNIVRVGLFVLFFIIVILTYRSRR